MGKKIQIPSLDSETQISLVAKLRPIQRMVPIQISLVEAIDGDPFTPVVAEVVVAMRSDTVVDVPHPLQ
ncbi:hypothetical protein V6N13_073207 [Hibiscus sabdariffa]|uniref:Uncharacterized protein n=1 Tax=Hibiscus sabdariffa TaxID=183260 RepID=A0ABR2E8F8_9ROSI